MMRSLYSGVAGLRTHQTKMDVIGNNISNVNTTAYKASSIVFSELMSQTTQKASGPNAQMGTGGTNARQIGLGVRSGAININITGQGSSQSTGNPFDIMINGDNFFVVNNGLENFFTRDGSFYVDGAGNLAMTSTGYNVMGWQVDEETGNIKQDTVSALRIMNAVNMTYPPEATTLANFSGILDKNNKDVVSAKGKAVNLNFFDALGYSYTAKFVFKQSGDVNEYSLELDKILDSTGKEVVSGAAAKALFGDANTTQLKEGKITFGADYSWNNGVLQRGGNPIVDLTTLIDTTTGVWKAGTELVDDPASTTTPKEQKTVEEMLGEVAKAYGYEGSVDAFMSQLYQTVDANGNPTGQYTMEDMLKRQAGVAAGTGDVPANTPLIGDIAASGADIETIGREFQGVKINFDGKKGNFAGINNQITNTTAMLNLSALNEMLGVDGQAFEDIKIDFSQTSMYDNKGTSTIGADKGGVGDEDGLGTGRRLGDMIGVSIQQDGMIYAAYDNGMTRLLGQIATASFANASGLEKKGDNLYSATLNSGEFDGIGTDITANGGSMSTGQLEMSNVDLSSEFTEMITTQRGFQANSRIITVSDTMLEELTNLKR